MVRSYNLWLKEIHIFTSSHHLFISRFTGNFNYRYGQGFSGRAHKSAVETGISPAAVSGYRRMPYRFWHPHVLARGIVLIGMVFTSLPVIVYLFNQKTLGHAN
jgi:hypothetical protein